MALCFTEMSDKQRRILDIQSEIMKPKNRAIVQLLLKNKKKPRAANDIALEIGNPLQNTMYHLTKLATLEIIRVRVHKGRAHYSLNENVIDIVKVANTKTVVAE